MKLIAFILTVAILGGFTLYSFLWVHRQYARIQNEWIKICLGLAVGLLCIFGPMLLLGYLMNDLKIVEFGYYGRCSAFFLWIAPTLSYVIYCILINRRRKHPRIK
jgi:hypothetical protein